jgi:hypothetical protein
MIKPNSARRSVAVLVVAALMLVAGGVAIASNMGFKMNRALIPVQATPPNSFQGSNWVAIPFNHPYTNGDAFCVAMDLVGTGATYTGRRGTNPASLTTLDPTTGSFLTRTCGLAATMIFRKSEGVQVRQQVQRPGFAGDLVPPASMIIVGSHDPTFVVSIPNISTTNANVGNLWYAMPYHTTAVTVADFCTQAALGNLIGTITRLNASTGSFLPTAICGTPSANSALVLGDFIQVRRSGGKTFVPAHF